jgi:hypothetical protein
MPSKHWLTHLAIAAIPAIDPKDRKAVADHDRVRATLVDFKKVAVLPSSTRDRLTEDLVAAGRIARGGLNARKRHVSNKALGKQVFMGDVKRAMEQAGLPVKWWQKWYDIGSDENDGGNNESESLYFQLAHALSDDFGLNLPKDLKPLARLAAQAEYGVMSPGMEIWQAAELVAQRRRRLLKIKADAMAVYEGQTGGLAVRLKNVTSSMAAAP